MLIHMPMCPDLACLLFLIAINLGASSEQDGVRAEQATAFPIAEDAIDSPFSVTVNGHSIPADWESKE